MTVTYGAGPSGKKRPPNRPSGRDLDRMVFGPSEDEMEDVEPEAPRPRQRQPRDDAGYAGAQRSGRDYSRLPEGSGAYPRVEDNRRGPLILAAAFALVLVFGLVVWNAYRDGVRPADGEAAPQLAEAGPFKSRPDPAEERTDPVAGASVFDSVEPSSSQAASQAAPDAPDAAAPPAAASEEVATEAAVPSATEVRPEPPPAPAADRVQPAGPPPSPSASSSAGKTPAPAPAASPAASVTPAPPPAAAPRAAVSGGPAFAAGGRYVVQLGAPSSEAAAQAEWDRRRRAMPELLSGAERFIVRADVNGRTVYRVRAGSFATAADADAFCGMIKARGGDCFRTEK